MNLIVNVRRKIAERKEDANKLDNAKNIANTPKSTIMRKFGLITQYWFSVNI